MTNSEIDIFFMALALEEAARAEAMGEVPVGAVLVKDGEVFESAHNLRESAHDPTAHAEMILLRGAALKQSAWRAVGTTLYVTLEPCIMCMGAIIQARVPRLVFGAMDPKAGACGSLYDFSTDLRLNHRVEVTSGVMAEEAGRLLKDFFQRLRRTK